MKREADAKDLRQWKRMQRAAKKRAKRLARLVASDPSYRAFL